MPIDLIPQTLAALCLIAAVFGFITEGGHHD